ncbi:hypothetical protein CYLTODRAFT_421325 [Cylindrobasidium torrendii FP15055 ss-10]|uniref:Uncharacterized protein n=1 Tax=Cylindrobasidium torrendii FP15055 ss-10 TaxID=1314674 RepID=A0A0D7BE09_9AGAR|nr:hypothetical protein CYLTODRAFT_421325 [Cylindrobasidium torrendii FP15055 ss-10]
MPQTSTAPRRDSNALRASVFDVFMELGALDANSKLASMILGETPEEDEDEEQDGARTPRGSSDGAFTPGGSKYRERFDSFILPDFEPERPSRDKERGFKGLAGRSRSRRRKDKHEPAEDSPTSHKRSIWHGFKRSKSNTRDKAKAERRSEDTLAPPPLPSSRSQSAAANYAGDGTAPPPTPTVTFPTLDRSDARSFATSAWVDVSADSRSVVAVPASEHQEYNPFLTACAGPSHARKCRPASSA